MAGSVGFWACALFVTSAENKEIRRMRDALRLIIVESGRVDIANWPTQQQRCMSIAIHALGLDINGEPKGKRSNVRRIRNNI